ncbi:MAG: ABC transporter ATP-binding protein [Candidatus Velthaea sp.]
MTTFRALLPLLRSLRAHIAWVMLAIAFDAFLTALRPWPLKVVIDVVLAHRHSRVPFFAAWIDRASADPVAILNGACVAMLTLAASTGFAKYWYTRALGSIGQHFVFTLRRDLFAHMQRLSLGFHERHRTGDLVTRLTTDMQSIQDTIANGMAVFTSNAFLLIGIVSFMLWLNWQFALVALSVSPLLFWLIFRNTQQVKAASRAARKSSGSLASVAQETLRSVRIVQCLTQEGQQDERFRSEGMINQAAFFQSVRFQARVAPLVDVLSALGLILVMRYGAAQVMSGAITTGDLIVFFTYLTNLYGPMRALARRSNAFSRAEVAAERIVEILDEKSAVIDMPNAQPVPISPGRIRFHDVSFAYTNGRRVLSRINLTISPNEKVAIVGSTGSGKSTLVGLLQRVYDPTAGFITIGGRDIRDYALRSLRERIAPVLQDAFLFSGTVRENIAFGRPNATDEEILSAAIVAGAHDFITLLPDGYATWLTEAGASLSGGQKQRIAIARAVLYDAPILILDEPTSGMDANSEKTVIDALTRASEGRTTLIVAHRLTSIRFVDRIVVLENGEIVEDGSHGELLRFKGKYAHYHSLQGALELPI